MPDSAYAAADREPTPGREPRILRGAGLGRLADGVAALLVLALTTVSLLYVARVPDLDPITIWPFWFWTAIFAGLGLILSPLLRRRRTALVIALTVLTGLLLNEEPLYLARAALRSCTPLSVETARESFRVITLNCRLGTGAAVRDALEFDPDVIMLQESPGGSSIDRVLPEGWEHVGRIDTAVLVRGSLHADEHPRWLAHEMHVVRAVPERVGQPLTIISAHLVKPSIRTDIWRPSTWRRAGMLRDARVNGVRHLLEQQHRYGNLPVIIGGDFNAGDHDPLLLPLMENGFSDAFRATGAGWPNSFSADVPVERIDYVWIDDNFEPLRSFTVRTPHSDHRMVIADVALRRQ